MSIRVFLNQFLARGVYVDTFPKSYVRHCVEVYRSVGLSLSAQVNLPV